MKVVIKGVFPFSKEQIADIADITVLTGPQASGKTIFLESFKLALDEEYIKKYVESIVPVSFESRREFLRHYFATDIADEDHLCDIIEDNASKDRELPRDRKERSFYVPSHRALLILFGNFKSYSELQGFPFVVRYYSQKTDGIHARAQNA